MRNAIKVFGLLLLVSRMDAQQVKLAWDPSPPPPAPCQVVGYRVYRSTVSGQYDDTKRITANPVAVGTDAAPFIDQAALQRGTTYYYVVTAFGGTPCSVPDSGYSNEVTAVVPNLLPLPAPSTLTLTCSSDGKLMTATWSAVLNATDYWPRAQYTDTFDWIPEGTKDGGNPATSITFPVASGRPVDFWVHPFNATYPPADPGWPMGVGDSGRASGTCTQVTPIPKPTNLRLTSPIVLTIPWNKKTTVTIAADNATRMSLFLNNEATARKSVNGSTLSYVWRPSSRGVHPVRGVASNTAGSIENTWLLTVK